MDSNRTFFTFLVCVIALLSCSKKIAIPFRPNAYDADSLKTGEWVYYYDEYFDIIEKAKKATYYRLVTFEKGEPVGEMGDYYANGKPQMVGRLLSENPEIFEGKSTYYGENEYVVGIEYSQKGVVDHRKSLEELRIVYEEWPEDKEQISDYLLLLSNLADLYIYNIQYEEAESLYLEVVAIQKRT
ncbi:MAG: hypothetical protein JXQ90_09890 [Cyclobacteriaceae bacterium]